MNPTNQLQQQATTATVQEEDKGMIHREASSQRRTELSVEDVYNNYNVHVDFSTGVMQNIPGFLETFRLWLLNVPHGDRGEPKVCDLTNCKRILTPVDRFIRGLGVGYKNWPDSVVLFPGKHVNMKDNFVNMMEVGKGYEKQHGRDKGNGWVYRHPLKKLLLYQQDLRRRGLVS